MADAIGIRQEMLRDRDNREALVRLAQLVVTSTDVSHALALWIHLSMFFIDSPVDVVLESGGQRVVLREEPSIMGS